MSATVKNFTSLIWLALKHTSLIWLVLKHTFRQSPLPRLIFSVSIRKENIVPSESFHNGHIIMFTFAFSLLCCVFASSIIMINALVVGLPACRPDQIRALVRFKNEFESRGCNNSDYVHGVMCDNTTGAVTKLT